MSGSTLEVLFRRRSIRHYKPDPLPRETLEQLLRAAMAAPSACNSQPWEFIVVDEPESLRGLIKVLRFGQYNPPAAIVVCANLKIANNSAGKHFWQQDCSAAIENILIAATGLGIGSVWIGVYPIPGVLKAVRHALNIPEAVIPLGVVYVGFPDENKPSRTQYDPKRVYWQTYEARKPRMRAKNAKNKLT
jgi:nitroreductase